MRRRRAMGMGVAVVVSVVVGMSVSHGSTLYYNITGVHFLGTAAVIARSLATPGNYASPSIASSYDDLRMDHRMALVRMRW
jgi:hypothetical protein